MIRSVVVQKIPMCSTVMTYSRVSLPCEPWERPTAPAPVPVIQSAPDHEALILATIKSGTNIFGDIVTKVFGPRMGSVDDRARDLMLDMLKRGVLKRERTITLSGNPYIWEIAE